ncbi:MAG: ABC transporter ATP-binding protein [Rhodospirillum sp.]|nr:ABC transporter ATP-binding protein [Rhodospirillum sp.]MCF8489739.1 ABC transporter ATP-binding protein [Rhodospirillum sp.]
MATDNRAVPLTDGPATSSPLLGVEDLGIAFGATKVVEGLRFSVDPGRTLAIVGESGSGKSITSLAVMGLLGSSASVSGRALFRRRDGEVVDLLRLSPGRSRALRGDEIAMVFQEPMTALNPVLRIGDQLVEVLRNHGRPTRGAARARALEMLRTVGIPDPESRLHAYPHELSGGMRQRVMIAMALMLEPGLLIADEPTTALDVTIQAQILLLLRRLQKSLGMALVFITHDLGIVGQIADDVAVMYSGRVVEAGPARAVLATPNHPYTRGLLGSAPQVDASGTPLPLKPIPGIVPSPVFPPAGCRFHPRCGEAKAGLCDRTEPVLEPTGSARGVSCLRWKEIAS